MSLSAAQIRQYHEHGVLVAPNVLTAADLQPVIDALNAWVDRRAQAFYEDGRINDLATGLGFDQRIAALYDQDKQITAGMDIMQMRDPALFRFLFNRNLLDAVEGLIGPELSCNPIQHLRAKMPGKATDTGTSYEGNVPWHQDAAVTWEEADPTDIVTCWLPLIDATEETGCMEIIPDVVPTGYLEHQKEGGTMIKPEVMPSTKAFVAECPRGGVVFMNKYTPHRGLNNVSNKVRWTLDLRYHPTGQPSGRPFWPSFVVRSASNPASVQDSFEEWNQRWDEALVKSRGIAWHRTVPVDQRMPAAAS